MVVKKYFKYYSRILTGKIFTQKFIYLLVICIFITVVIVYRLNDHKTKEISLIPCKSMSTFQKETNFELIKSPLSTCVYIRYSLSEAGNKIVEQKISVKPLTSIPKGKILLKTISQSIEVTYIQVNDTTIKALIENHLEAEISENTKTNIFPVFETWVKSFIQENAN